jgi:hypothetical protein
MLLFRVDRHWSDQPGQHTFGSSGYAVLHIIGLSFSCPGHHGYPTHLLTPASPVVPHPFIAYNPKDLARLAFAFDPSSLPRHERCLPPCHWFVHLSLNQVDMWALHAAIQTERTMRHFFLISSSLHVAPPSSIVPFHALIFHVSPHGSPACLCSMHDANGFSRHIHPHEFPFPCGCTCSPTLPSLPNFIHSICPLFFDHTCSMSKKHLVRNDF